MRPLCFHSHREGPSGAEMDTENIGSSSSLGRERRREKWGETAGGRVRSRSEGKGVQVARRRCHLSAWAPCHPKGLFAKPRNRLFLPWEAYEMSQVTLTTEQGVCYLFRLCLAVWQWASHWPSLSLGCFISTVRGLNDVEAPSCSNRQQSLM